MDSSGNTEINTYIELRSEVTTPFGYRISVFAIRPVFAQMGVGVQIKVEGVRLQTCTAVPLSLIRANEQNG